MAMAMERDEEGKHCPVCGNWFYRKGVFCSDACFEKYQDRKTACAVCGKEFETAYLKKMCCSDGCRTRQQKTHKSRVLLLMKPFKRECPVCGIHFYSTSSTYCSEKCENAEW